ncbi:MAG: hypothetical protein FJZ56_02105 [Chlamydiae bacterium]|nr:hypothetical protein [Chlamydiota bacterium]
MRRKLIAFSIMCCFTVTSVPILAEDTLMSNNTRTNSLTWGPLTDPDMKKTATAMTMWGIIFVVAISIISLAIPQSPTPTTNTTTN